MKQIIILIILFTSFITFSQKCNKKDRKKEINKCKVKIWKDSTRNRKPKVFKRKKRVRKKHRKTKHINKRKK